MFGAGLGGDVFYFRNILSGTKYYSFIEEWVLSAGARVGYILGLGQDVEIADRFFLGGDTLRGFATAGVGPRDRNTGDSLGGEWIYNAGQFSWLDKIPSKLWGLIEKTIRKKNK